MQIHNVRYGYAWLHSPGGGAAFASGAEIDLVMARAGRLRLFEVTLSKAPRPSRGFFELAGQLRPEGAWVIAPVDEPFEWRKGVWVTPLSSLTID